MSTEVGQRAEIKTERIPVFPLARALCYFYCIECAQLGEAVQFSMRCPRKNQKREILHEMKLLITFS